MNLDGLRVLVVEDESLVSMVIEDCLDVLGCKVVGTASRLEEALEKAASLAIDAALLDVNLAGRLSYPVAEVLRARGLPFIFATGYGTDGVPPDLRDAPVLAKPLALQQLAAALRAAGAPDPE